MSTTSRASYAPTSGVCDAYDRPTVLLHWLTVVLVFAQFVTALAIDRAPAGWPAGLLHLHRSTGVALWLLVMGRLLWKATGMRAPPLPPGTARWHAAGVRVSEFTLYGLLVLQPLTGAADTVLRARSFALFGLLVPRLTVRNQAWAHDAAAAHLLGAWALAALIGAHAGAAIIHHYVRKDGVLAAMAPWTRRRRAP